MNVRMNESKNEKWMNELKNEKLMNEWKNEWIKEWKK